MKKTKDIFRVHAAQSSFHLGPRDYPCLENLSAGCSCLKHLASQIASAPIGRVIAGWGEVTRGVT